MFIGYLDKMGDENQFIATVSSPKMSTLSVYLLCSENKLAYLLTFFSLLFFVKSSETKIDFHQELLTTACPFCIFAFEGGLKVANQQPCRKKCGRQWKT